jgi:hypothetical protein
MKIRMDDRTGKHLAKDQRTDTQRTTTNIFPQAELRNFFFLMSSFFSFLAPKNKQD